MAFFDIEFRTRVGLEAEAEPSRYISEYDGVIRCERESDGATQRVGRVRAYRINSGLAQNEGESLFDVCDSHSQGLHDVYAHFYESGGYGFTDRFVDRYHAFDFDCLVIDYVVIAPKWRGLKLGLLALRRTVDVLGAGCGLAVSMIAPLNYTSHSHVKVPARWLPWHETEAEHHEAVVKLRRYVRQMGWVRLRKTFHYFLPMALETPTAAELLKRPTTPT